MRSLFFQPLQSNLLDVFHFHRILFPFGQDYVKFHELMSAPRIQRSGTLAHSGYNVRHATGPGVSLKKKKKRNKKNNYWNIFFSQEFVMLSGSSKKICQKCQIFR